MGIPTAAIAELELELKGLVGVAVKVVDCDTPEVNGTVVAEEAPEKATVVVVGSGVAAVLFGLRTLFGVSAQS